MSDSVVDLEWNENGSLSKDWSDSSGVWPTNLKKYLGKMYFHRGRGHLYMVLGTTYQSEDNRWMLAYQRITVHGEKTGPLFCHRPEDFNIKGRFMEVNK